MTDIPTLTPLPDPPQRGQDATLFAALADAFLDALPGLTLEINAFGAQLVQATQERVVNQAADSYNGALAARDDARAARDAAQGYAASVNPQNLVATTGDQSVDGAKTFVQKIIATAGLRIAGVDLTALTAAGKALAEAADVNAQRSLLGIVEAAGGVGAFVIAASTALPATSYVAFGTTVSGSSLVTSPSNTAASLGGQNFSQPSVTPGVNPGGTATSLGLSGTWRLQTTLGTLGSGDPMPLGLWKRIA